MSSQTLVLWLPGARIIINQTGQMNLLSLLIQAHQYELDLPLGTSMLRIQILNFLGSYSMTARTTFLGLGKTH